MPPPASPVAAAHVALDEGAKLGFDGSVRHCDMPEGDYGVVCSIYVYGIPVALALKNADGQLVSESLEVKQRLVYADTKQPVPNTSGPPLSANCPTTTTLTNGRGSMQARISTSSHTHRHRRFLIEYTPADEQRYPRARYPGLTLYTPYNLLARHKLRRNNERPHPYRSLCVGADEDDEDDEEYEEEEEEEVEVTHSMAGLSVAPTRVLVPAC